MPYQQQVSTGTYTVLMLPRLMRSKLVPYRSPGRHSVTRIATGYYHIHSWRAQFMDKMSRLFYGQTRIQEQDIDSRVVGSSGGALRWRQVRGCVWQAHSQTRRNHMQPIANNLCYEKGPDCAIARVRKGNWLCGINLPHNTANITPYPSP
jgi:phage terminase large subunit-like protein